ncbi:MAG: uroporphyrinogen-III synthase [Actinomycetota bacterium]
MNLTGKRVVLTRQAGKNQRLAAMLEERGAVPIEAPTIAIVDPPAWTEVDASVRRLFAGEFEWVVFSSGNAVTRYCARLGCTPAAVFGKTKVAAVGSTTEQVLREKGVEVDLVPGSYTAVDLALALGEGSGRVLMPRAQDVPAEMTNVLSESGWTPEPVTVYRTETAEGSGPGAARVRAGDFDVVTLTSASTVRGFAELFGAPESLELHPSGGGSRSVVCIGPVTAAACEELGFRIDAQADPHTIEGLTSALEGLPDERSAGEMAR